ncbi:MAG: PaaI family thioesterase [Desulfomonile tiedjei]|nr:PaaI family thioesterase [Desulfomonile tiedjei]
MKTLVNPYRDGGCFFCGSANLQGLRLTFQETETEPNELVCRWVPSPVYKGFGTVLHGGIQSGLFDEIMGWTTLHLTREVAVTASLDVKFVRPLHVDQQIEVRCRIESRNGARVNLAAEIKNSKGEICTTATGTYVIMTRERFKRAVGEE